jgi:hypothetical protein
MVGPIQLRKLNEQTGQTFAHETFHCSVQKYNGKAYGLWLFVWGCVLRNIVKYVTAGKRKFVQYNQKCLNVNNVKFVRLSFISRKLDATKLKVQIAS